MFATSKSAKGMHNPVCITTRKLELGEKSTHKLYATLDAGKGERCND